MRGGRWLRTRIETFLDYWIPALALTGWRISVRWRSDRDLKRAKHSWGEFEALTMRAPVRMEAAVYFDLGRMAKLEANDEGVEETVIHELLHVLSWQLSETAVHAIARALVRARRGV